MKMTTAYPTRNPDPKRYKKFKDCSDEEKKMVKEFIGGRKNVWPLGKTWWNFSKSYNPKHKGDLSASAYGGGLCL